MSPESLGRFGSTESITGAVDVWGLGVTALEAFTGETPKEADEKLLAETFKGLKEQHKNDSQGKPVIQLIENMLQWKPRERSTLGKIVSDVDDMDATKRS